MNTLKKKVLAANLSLPEHQLITFTWGNVSAVSYTHLDVYKRQGEHYSLIDSVHHIRSVVVPPQPEKSTAQGVAVIRTVQPREK